MLQLYNCQSYRIGSVPYLFPDAPWRVSTIAMVISSSDPLYQVGGSLPYNSPTYVHRQADEALFQGLLRGDFCYVFNARQMGKSSLRVQTTHRLQTQGVRCSVIDMTVIGSQEITLEQWYGSIAGLLTKTLGLKLNLLQWWQARSHLSVVNRLSDFFDTVVLPQIPEPIVIFIDNVEVEQTERALCNE